MHTNRNHYQAPLWAVALLCLTIGSSLATPTDDITRAVAASGAANVASASPAQFVGAFSTVLTRVRETNFPQWVTSAIRLRSDLAPEITAAALRAHQVRPREACDWVNPIIRAGIAAAPEASAAIVRAALEIAPASRACILAAAGPRNEQSVSVRPAGVDAGNINSSAIGTINPSNITGQGNIQSGNQERVTICHAGTTLVLPRPAAEAHIRAHPGDYLGSCHP